MQNRGQKLKCVQMLSWWYKRMSQARCKINIFKNYGGFILIFGKTNTIM